MTKAAKAAKSAKAKSKTAPPTRAATAGQVVITASATHVGQEPYTIPKYNPEEVKAWVTGPEVPLYVFPVGYHLPPCTLMDLYGPALLPQHAALVHLVDEIPEEGQPHVFVMYMPPKSKDEEQQQQQQGGGDAEGQVATQDSGLVTLAESGQGALALSLPAHSLVFSLLRLPFLKEQLEVPLVSVQWNDVAPPAKQGATTAGSANGCAAEGSSSQLRGEGPGLWLQPCPPHLFACPLRDASSATAAVVPADVLWPAGADPSTAIAKCSHTLRGPPCAFQCLVQMVSQGHTDALRSCVSGAMRDKADGGVCMLPRRVLDTHVELGAHVLPPDGLMAVMEMLLPIMDGKFHTGGVLQSHASQLLARIMQNADTLVAMCRSKNDSTQLRQFTQALAQEWVQGLPTPLATSSGHKGAAGTTPMVRCTGNGSASDPVQLLSLQGSPSAARASSSAPAATEAESHATASSSPSSACGVASNSNSSTSASSSSSSTSASDQGTAYVLHKERWTLRPLQRAWDPSAFALWRHTVHSHVWLQGFYEEPALAAPAGGARPLLVRRGASVFKSDDDSLFLMTGAGVGEEVVRQQIAIARNMFRGIKEVHTVIHKAPMDLGLKLPGSSFVAILQQEPPLASRVVAPVLTFRSSSSSPLQHFHLTVSTAASLKPSAAGTQMEVSTACYSLCLSWRRPEAPEDPPFPGPPMPTYMLPQPQAEGAAAKRDASSAADPSLRSGQVSQSSNAAASGGGSSKAAATLAPSFTPPPPKPGQSKTAKKRAKKKAAMAGAGGSSQAGIEGAAGQAEEGADDEEPGAVPDAVADELPAAPLVGGGTPSAHEGQIVPQQPPTKQQQGSSSPGQTHAVPCSLPGKAETKTPGSYANKPEAGGPKEPAAPSAANAAPPAAADRSECAQNAAMTSAASAEALLPSPQPGGVRVLLRGGKAEAPSAQGREGGSSEEEEDEEGLDDDESWAVRWAQRKAQPAVPASSMVRTRSAGGQQQEPPQVAGGAGFQRTKTRTMSSSSQVSRSNSSAAPVRPPARAPLFLLGGDDQALCDGTDEEAFVVCNLEQLADYQADWGPEGGSATAVLTAMQPLGRRTSEAGMGAAAVPLADAGGRRTSSQSAAIPPVPGSSSRSVQDVGKAASVCSSTAFSEAAEEQGTSGDPHPHHHHTPASIRDDPAMVWLSAPPPRPPGASALPFPVRRKRPPTDVASSVQAPDVAAATATAAAEVVAAVAAAQQPSQPAVGQPQQPQLQVEQPPQQYESGSEQSGSEDDDGEDTATALCQLLLGRSEAAGSGSTAVPQQSQPATSIPSQPSSSSLPQHPTHAGHSSSALRPSDVPGMVMLSHYHLQRQQPPVSPAPAPLAQGMGQLQQQPVSAAPTPGPMFPTPWAGPGIQHSLPASIPMPVPIPVPLPIHSSGPSSAVMPTQQQAATTATSQPLPPTAGLPLPPGAASPPAPMGAPDWLQVKTSPQGAAWLTPVFRLFASDHGNAANWWWLDAAGRPCGPTHPEHMILAVASGQLGLEVGVCGTAEDVLPPMLPPPHFFEPLGGLLTKIAGRGRYALVQRHEI